MNKKNLLLLLAIIALAAASRLVKHPPNFTPLAALGLFAGFYFNKKYLAAVPVLAMILSDWVLGFYDWRLQAIVYLSIAAAYVIGWLFKKNASWRKVALGSLSASVLFFITTNFAVWALYEWYPHTFSGLLACYTAALPFFRNTLAGDLFYSVILFGAYELAWFYLSRKQFKPMKL